MRYLAKGDFLSETADLHGISKSSASRIIPSVCSSLVKHYPVRYPTDPGKLLQMKTKFFQVASFPNVVGCIDGVLVGIQTPYEHEVSYVCRKGFHAINVQAISDADMRFINIVVKWPGATHDSFILNNSEIAGVLAQHNLGWLLGDSGYPLKTFLMTPFIHAVQGQQLRYKLAHARTRNVVERSFGILKARFRCLDRSGGSICYQPEKAVTIIAVCFSLHNVAMDKKLPVPDHVENANDDDNIVCDQVPVGRAQDIRNNLVRRF